MEAQRRHRSWTPLDSQHHPHGLCGWSKRQSLEPWTPSVKTSYIPATITPGLNRKGAIHLTQPEFPGSAPQGWWDGSAAPSGTQAPPSFSAVFDLYPSSS